MMGWFNLENFTLGAGCWANPIDCYKINKELDRIREKVETGEPISAAEEQWVQTGGTELHKAAKETADDLREPARQLSATFIWPIALAIGVAIAIR